MTRLNSRSSNKCITTQNINFCDVIITSLKWNNSSKRWKSEEHEEYSMSAGEMTLQKLLREELNAETGADISYRLVERLIYLDINGDCRRWRRMSFISLHKKSVWDITTDLAVCNMLKQKAREKFELIKRIKVILILILR